MAVASLWADEHRRDVKGSGPWHYVDVPLDQDRYDDRFAGTEPQKGYIIPKIREFRPILKDPARPLEERRQALRFLLHLVEDLHMPLHVGDNHDRGGNDTQVRFFDHGTNMHRSGIRTSSNEPAATRRNGWPNSIAMDTDEARLQVHGGLSKTGPRRACWPPASLPGPTSGQKIKKGHKLADAYHSANLPIARQRLYQAGVRLAKVLNDVFEEK